MIRLIQKFLLVLLLISATALRLCAEDSTLAEVVAQLRQQNQQLQEQLQKQNAAIESLNRKVTTLEEKNPVTLDKDNAAPAPAAGFGGALAGNVRLGGAGAVGLFSTGPNGTFPNSEFRVDELRLFVDAALGQDVYGFVELNLATRENTGPYSSTQLGEAYVDFENVSRLWHQDGRLNIRLGRLDIPFGEEYLRRDAVDNPLISHSVSDFWGIDEGIELYGAVGKVNYVLAVQNGGISTTRDYNSDKSVALRVSGDPLRWLHLGVSAMRTGDLSAADEWSELWIGNGFFRPIGSTNTTRFNVNLLQGDVHVRFPHGHLHFAGGVARYDDDDSAADNRRDFKFLSAEAVHTVTGRLYAGARFSQIWVDGGYPLVGQGDFGHYFFGVETEDLWRLSLGLGYRFSDNLILKTEYSFEGGTKVTGARREDEDMFSAQVAFKF